MNDIVYIPDVVTSEKAIRILIDQLLGKDYICCDSPCSGYQANAMIVRDIIEKYTKSKCVVISRKDYGE